MFFAALTSSISLMETVVSILQDRFGWKRMTSCLAVLAGSVLLGIPSSLGNGLWSRIRILGFTFLDFFDFISNSLLMPIVAFLTCLFAGYVIKPDTLVSEVEKTGRFAGKKLFIVMIRYIAPVCILLILLSSVLSALGCITI